LVSLGAFIAAQHVRDAAIDMRTSTDPGDDQALVLSPRAARFAALGYNELAADIAWSYTLVYYGDGMQRDTHLVHGDKLIEEVNALDPYFRRPYQWGGYATTFRRAGEPSNEEFAESVKVLERGVERFPNDWELAWILGQRYFFDLKSDDAEVAK